jgi:hypothetical protein
MRLANVWIKGEYWVESSFFDHCASDGSKDRWMPKGFLASFRQVMD